MVLRKAGLLHFCCSFFGSNVLDTGYRSCAPVWQAKAAPKRHPGAGEAYREVLYCGLSIMFIVQLGRGLRHTHLRQVLPEQDGSVRAVRARRSEAGQQR